MHIYENDGILLPSVTTVIHTIYTHPNIIRWSNWLGFKHKKYDEVLNGYARFGTEMHSCLQKFMKPDSILDEIGVSGFNIIKLNKILQTFETFCLINNVSPDNTIAVEMEMKSNTLGYAGTIDWLGSYKNELVLWDYKSSKNVNKMMFIQLGGYYGLLKENGYDINSASILIISETRVKEYKLSREELIFYYGIFIKCLDLFYAFIDAGIIPGLSELLNQNN